MILAAGIPATDVCLSSESLCPNAVVVRAFFWLPMIIANNDLPGNKGLYV